MKYTENDPKIKTVRLALAKMGILALYGGRKGHGFWIYKTSIAHAQAMAQEFNPRNFVDFSGQVIMKNDGVKSGNKCFWMFADIENLILKNADGITAKTKARITKRARTHTPRKGSKQANPEQVAEIKETLKAACEMAAGSVGKPVKLADYVRDNPRAGIPIKGDRISFIKIETQEYKGLIIPILDEYLPAYVLVNQKGELMRMVSSDCKKMSGDILDLTWACRSISKFNDLEYILGAAKKLTTWRNLSIKAKAKTEEINLADKKTADNSFCFFAQYFTDQLKGIEFKATSFFTIGGRFFPAQTMRDILKLLKNELVTLTVRQDKTIEIVYTCEGLKGRATIKAAKIDSNITSHFIPVI